MTDKTHDTRIHPVTGKLLTRTTRVQTITVGNLCRTVNLPGWYPDDDSDSIHSGADMEEDEKVYLELCAELSAKK